MPLNRSSLMFAATLLVAGMVVAWVILRTERRAATGADPVAWQRADTPPADRGHIPDPRLTPPAAWLDAAAPVVDGIGPPFHGEARPGAHVVAAADGIVLFSGMRDGRAEVRLAHRDETGQKFESIYSPLATATAQPGELIGRGMPVGTMGDHDLITIFPIPPDAPRFDGGLSPLAEAMSTPDPDPWMWLEMENAGRFLELMRPNEE